MKDHEIKKEDWENNLLSHLLDLGHPIVPGPSSLANYKKCIEKYAKGNKALIFGATWQLRDLLTDMGFEVTVVDISKEALDVHSSLCKIKDKNETLIVGNWLEFSSEEKFDLILGDDSNIQLEEGSYSKFFSNVSNLLNDKGITIQVIEGMFKDERSSLQEVIDFINNSSIEEIKDCKNIAYYYLSYALHNHGHKFKNLAQIEHDLKGKVSEEKYNVFNLNAVDFSAAILSVETMEKYIFENLELIEKFPASKTHVEECFYWMYVLGKK